MDPAATRLTWHMARGCCTQHSCTTPHLFRIHKLPPGGQQAEGVCALLEQGAQHVPAGLWGCQAERVQVRLPAQAIPAPSAVILVCAVRINTHQLRLCSVEACLKLVTLSVFLYVSLPLSARLGEPCKAALFQNTMPACAADKGGQLRTWLRWLKTQYRLSSLSCCSADSSSVVCSF